MCEKSDDSTTVEIRAVQGIGASDTFYNVKVPNQGPLSGKLECPHDIPVKSDTYANLPAVYLVREEGTEFIDEMNEPSIEHAAIWIPARHEWVGIEVSRTKIYEGAWQGFDESLGCNGPFQLATEFGAMILRAFKSKSSIDPGEVLKTDPSEL